MPAHPTWKQVADLAAKADGAESGMKGICLRGLPGWGEVMAPLTTVVNTFGGTWFDKNWKARLDSPEFEKAATKFYVDLVREHGESGAAQSGFAECLNNMTQGKTAMWYDATSAAGSLESAELPGQGQDRLRTRARREDRVLRLALHLGLGHPERVPQPRQGLEVRLLGVQQGVRAAGRRARSAGPTCRPASAPRRTRTRVPQGGRAPSRR